MNVKVVDLKMGGSSLAHTPVALSRITGAEDKINLNHMDLSSVPAEDVRILSVFSRVESGRQACKLLFFVRNQRRPFLIDGFKIQYSDFPIPRAETAVPQLRGFSHYLCQKNSNLGIDRRTFEFLTGKPPAVLDKEVVVLATALGAVLQKLDQHPSSQ